MKDIVRIGIKDDGLPIWLEGKGDYQELVALKQMIDFALDKKIEELERNGENRHLIVRTFPMLFGLDIHKLIEEIRQIAEKAQERILRIRIEKGNYKHIPCYIELDICLPSKPYFTEIEKIKKCWKGEDKQEEIQRALEKLE